MRWCATRTQIWTLSTCACCDCVRDITEGPVEADERGEVGRLQQVDDRYKLGGVAGVTEQKNINSRVDNPVGFRGFTFSELNFCILAEKIPTVRWTKVE